MTDYQKRSNQHHQFDHELGLACHSCRTPLQILPFYWRCADCQNSPSDLCDICYQEMGPDQHVLEHIWVKIKPPEKSNVKKYLDNIYRSLGI